jgi:hypothetical protein
VAKKEAEKGDAKMTLVPCILALIKIERINKQAQRALVLYKAQKNYIPVPGFQVNKIFGYTL